MACRLCADVVRDDEGVVGGNDDGRAEAAAPAVDADEGEVVAQVRPTRPALRAGPVGEVGLHSHQVAQDQPGDIIGDRVDVARELVAEDARAHLSHDRVAVLIRDREVLEEHQVRAADPGPGDADLDGPGPELGLRHLLEAGVGGTVEAEREHVVVSGLECGHCCGEAVSNAFRPTSLGIASATSAPIRHTAAPPMKTRSQALSAGMGVPGMRSPLVKRRQCGHGERRADGREDGVDPLTTATLPSGACVIATVRPAAKVGIVVSTKTHWRTRKTQMESCQTAHAAKTAAANVMQTTMMVRAPTAVTMRPA
jgi:hypothetical protein